MNYEDKYSGMMIIKSMIDRYIYYMWMVYSIIVIRAAHCCQMANGIINNYEDIICTGMYISQVLLRVHSQP